MQVSGGGVAPLPLTDLPCAVSLLAHDADALLDVVARLDLVDHGDGVVGVADDRLAGLFERQLLAAQEVGAGALALGLEVARGRDVGPLHVVAAAQLAEGLGHGGGKRLEGVREVRRVGNRHGVLGVHVQRARAAHDEQAHVRPSEAVAQVREGGRVLVEGLGRPGAEGVDDGIEAGEVGGLDVHDVLHDGLLGRGPVLAAHERGDVHAAPGGFLHDELACLAVRRDDCDLLHGGVLSSSVAVCHPLPTDMAYCMLFGIDMEVGTILCYRHQMVTIGGYLHE